MVSLFTIFSNASNVCRFHSLTCDHRFFVILLDPELKNWSIKEYAQSSRIENNWLTRQLSNQLAGELHDDDLNLAKEIVRQKFLVGLMTEIERTMERCEK